MEVATVDASSSFASYGPQSFSQREDSLVIESTLQSQSDTSQSSSTDTVNTSFEDLYKSLSVAAKEVIDKLNEILKKDLPNGIQSLSPEQVTPEATADRIVQGATAFFDLYSRQHPNLEGEELLSSFMDTIRGGIKSGYDDAVEILKGVGALDYEGVNDGIEQTKKLIDDKLMAYEAYMREELGLSPKTPNSVEDVANSTKNKIIEQGGGGTINIAA